MGYNLSDLPQEEQDAIELDKRTKFARYKAKKLLSTCNRSQIERILREEKPEFKELLRTALNEVREEIRAKNKPFKGSQSMMATTPNPNHYRRNAHDLRRESYQRNHELDPRIQKIMQDKKDATK